jgi:hypothetical protein
MSRMSTSFFVRGVRLSLAKSVEFHCSLAHYCRMRPNPSAAVHTVQLVTRKTAEALMCTTTKARSVKKLDKHERRPSNHVFNPKTWLIPSARIRILSSLSQPDLTFFFSPKSLVPIIFDQSRL